MQLLKGHLRINGGKFPELVRFHHGKLIASSLKVQMGKYGAACYGQTGIGADKIMGEYFQEIKEPLKGSAVYLHGSMLF